MKFSCAVPLLLNMCNASSAKMHRFAVSAGNYVTQDIFNVARLKNLDEMWPLLLAQQNDAWCTKK